MAVRQTIAREPIGRCPSDRLPRRRLRPRLRGAQERVNFNVVQGQKGLQAEDVTPE
jgi:hypothetical protein